MTVTELRDALNELIEQGHGGLEACYRDHCKMGQPLHMGVDAAKVMPDFDTGEMIVELGWP